MSAPFRHRLRVRYSDCDPQGVLFNANYLTYFDIAITELYREAMGSYERMRELGVDLVVAEATVRYLAPIRFDEEVELQATVTRLGTTSISTGFELHRLTAPEASRLAAQGSLRHVVVDLETAVKTPIPEAVRAELEPYSEHRARA